MRSGRHPALLPGAPLRTGRESYPSSGSSHCRAVAASHVVRVMAPPVYRHKVVRVVCPACVTGLVMMFIDEADVLFGIELDTTQGTCTALTFEQVSPPLPVGRFDQPFPLAFRPIRCLFRVHGGRSPMDLEVAFDRGVRVGS